MKKIVLLFGLLAAYSGFSQQDAIYSQYMYNQFVINPAYAGSRNSVSALLLHRTRWFGMDGSPITSTFSIHSGVGKSNFAWGGNVASDRLGATTNFLSSLTGAYHVRMRTGKLSIGLRLGIFNSSINGAKLDFRDPSDALLVNSRQSASLPNADFGLYYYTRKFYVGLSINHFIANKFPYTGMPEADFYLRSFKTLGAGYAIEINDNLMLKPSFLLRQIDGFDVNLDLNLSALFYNRIWFGVSLRNRVSTNFLLEANITDFMRVGYSYDLFINKLNTASNGAHEFFLGFDFKSKKTSTVSTRYL